VVVGSLVESILEETAPARLDSLGRTVLAGSEIAPCTLRGPRRLRAGLPVAAALPGAGAARPGRAACETLLLKLISGELCMPDAEQFLEARR